LINRYKICIPAIILFIAGFYSQAQSISNDSIKFKESEYLFEKFEKLGIYIGVQSLQWNNTNNASISYSMSSGLTPTLGFDYNFYQKGRFNFKAGFFVRNHKVVTETFISADELSDNRIYRTNNRDSPYWNYHLPISLEYNINIADNLYLSLGTGYELMLYSVTPRLGEFVELGIGPTPIIVTNEYESSNSLTSGVNFTTGFYYDLENILVKLDAKFHLHFGQNIITREINVQNLEISTDASSVHSWNGNYLSLNFTIIPKKWF
jgi:hypothetical protein